MATAAVRAEQYLSEIHILWMDLGQESQGDKAAPAAALRCAGEEIVLNDLPQLPKVVMHWPCFNQACRAGARHHAETDALSTWFDKAERGELGSFVLVVEGGVAPAATTSATDRPRSSDHQASRQSATMRERLDRLAEKSLAVLAVGAGAPGGGTLLQPGSSPGWRSVPDYLGWDWHSKAGIPLVCIPGCPIPLDDLSETLVYLLYHVAGHVTMIPLDDQLRPLWLSPHPQPDDLAYASHSSAFFPSRRGCTQHAQP